MKKNRMILILGIVLCVCVSVGVIAIAFHPQSPFALFGQAESRKSGENHGGLIAGGQPMTRSQEQNAKIITDEFYITFEEFDRVKEGYLISGMSEQEAEREAENLLMNKYTAYSLAVAGGYQLSDQEVTELLEEQKKLFAESGNMDNYGDYAEFLQGAEMTNEEYWDSQFETLMVYETIGRYKDALRQEFSQEETTEDLEQWKARFQEYYDHIIQTKRDSLQVEYRTRPEQEENR